MATYTFPLDHRVEVLASPDFPGDISHLHALCRVLRECPGVAAAAPVCECDRLLIVLRTTEARASEDAVKRWIHTAAWQCLQELEDAEPSVVPVEDLEAGGASLQP
jgi:hypothetical protein